MNKNKHLNDLSEIRRMMERASGYLSLSGTAGIYIGLFALIGAAAAYFHLGMDVLMPDYHLYAYDSHGEMNWDFILFFMADASLVLIFSLLTGRFFMLKKIKKTGSKPSRQTAMALLWALAVPLMIGGVFCAILLYHGLLEFIAPCTLIFYGLALVAASKFTFREIGLLGITEAILGLVSAIFVGYGLIFWAIGFGVMHMVYGAIMHYKYDKH